MGALTNPAAVAAAREPLDSYIRNRGRQWRQPDLFDPQGRPAPTYRHARKGEPATDPGQKTGGDLELLLQRRPQVKSAPEKGGAATIMHMRRDVNVNALMRGGQMI